MATQREKEFCVSQFVKLDFVAVVQKSFCALYNKPAPAHNTYHWNETMEQKGHICKGKSIGWLHMPEEPINCIHVTLE
jgi:hypothetical protein